MPRALTVRSTTPSGDRLLFGTDFSGLGVVSIQLERAIAGRHRCLQVFACESWAAARVFLKANRTGLAVSHDVMGRPIPAVWLHLYAARPPCQAWAPWGKRQGLSDAQGRGELFFEALRLIYL